jgi:tripartite motif-containing protein 71
LPSNTIFAEALELDVVDTICHAGTGPGRVNNPMGLLWLAGLKQLLIADTGNERVQVLDKDMRYIRSAHGIGNIALQEPIAFAANADESVLYVLDRAQDCVIICNPQLVYDTFFGGTGSNDGRLLSPSGIAVIADGRVIVSDTGNDRIQVFTPQGVYLQQFGSLGTDTTQFNSPAGLAFAPSGDLWICDPGNQRLLKYSADFLSPSAYDIGSDEVPELESPQLLTFDYFGRIFAADSALSRVTIFEAGGSYESLFGSRGTRANQFGDGGPYGLAIDEELGRLFISDPGNNRILEYRI